MMRIELVYDRDCPNVGKARATLLAAFAGTGIRPSWIEWERNAPEAPSYVRSFGSPTILVNGQDAVGANPHQQQDSCRLYSHEDGRFGGAPSTLEVVRALQRALHTDSGGRTPAGWRRVLAVVPAAGAALLPVSACPACWSAYVGLLGTLGLGFLLQATYLLPLTILLVGVALLTLGYRAGARRGYGPLVLGALGSGLILIGKFVVDFSLALYGGLILLVAASLWNTWPRRTVLADSCPKCARGDSHS